MAYPNNYPPQGPPPYPNNYSGYPPQGVAPYQQQRLPPVQPQPNYQLTREERQVLKECAQESFYRRCVPFMTALGLGAYYGVHLGYLKRHPAYGAGPKVSAGILIGFIAGKFSYKNQCEEKILRLPGGKLKEAIMKSRSSSDGLWSTSADDSGVYKDASITYALPPYASVPFQSNQQSTASELDIERPHDTFNDSFRIRSGDGNIAGDSDDLPPLLTPAQSTSYAELRNRNRETHEARHKQYRPGPVDDFSSSNNIGAFSPSPPPSDRFSRADDYQSPTAAADRSSRSSIYQTPTGGFDQYSQISEARFLAEQTVPGQQKVPIQRKNFYGDIIDK